MSESGTESDVEPEGESRVLKALIEFTGCIGGAFDDVCSYALIPGDGYIPFAPDEDDEENCEDEDCSQVWVRVTSMNPTPKNTEGWDGQECGFTMDLSLEVGIMRCMEVIAEGEAPTATAMLAYAMQAVEDSNVLMCAALGCDVGISLNIGSWTPLGPLGGEFGGSWTMTLQV